MQQDETGGAEQGGGFNLDALIGSGGQAPDPGDQEQQLSDGDLVRNAQGEVEGVHWQGQTVTSAADITGGLRNRASANRAKAALAEYFHPNGVKKTAENQNGAVITAINMNTQAESAVGVWFNGEQIVAIDQAKTAAAKAAYREHFFDNGVFKTAANANGQPVRNAGDDIKQIYWDGVAIERPTGFRASFPGTEANQQARAWEAAYNPTARTGLLAGAVGAPPAGGGINDPGQDGEQPAAEARIKADESGFAYENGNKDPSYAHSLKMVNLELELLDAMLEARYKGGSAHQVQSRINKADQLARAYQEYVRTNEIDHSCELVFAQGLAGIDQNIQNVARELFHTPLQSAPNVNDAQAALKGIRNTREGSRLDHVQKNGWKFAYKNWKHTVLGRYINHAGAWQSEKTRECMENSNHADNKLKSAAWYAASYAFGATTGLARLVDPVSMGRYWFNWGAAISFGGGAGSVFYFTGRGEHMLDVMGCENLNREAFANGTSLTDGFHCSPGMMNPDPTSGYTNVVYAESAASQEFEAEHGRYAALLGARPYAFDGTAAVGALAAALFAGRSALRAMDRGQIFSHQGHVNWLATDAARNNQAAIMGALGVGGDDDYQADEDLERGGEEFGGPFAARVPIGQQQLNVKLAVLRGCQSAEARANCLLNEGVDAYGGNDYARTMFREGLDNAQQRGVLDHMFNNMDTEPRFGGLHAQLNSDYDAVARMRAEV